MANNKIIIIDSLADLPAPSGGTHTLEPNSTYLFNQDTFALGANSLTFSTGTQIQGLGKNATVITYSGASSLINATNTNILIRAIQLQSTVGSVFNISNTSTFSLFAEDVNFMNCVSLGTVAGGGCFWRYCAAMSCVTGLTLSGALGSCIFDTCSFRAMSGGANSFGLTVLNGATGISFRAYKNIIDASATHYGIRIQGTYVLSAGGILEGNVFSGAGTRLAGVNGNSTNWTITFGVNLGIGGLQYVDVEIGTTADATFGNGAGTYTEPSTVRSYIYSLAEYDPFATVMEAKVAALITSAEATFQMGVRNLTSATNLGGLKAAVLPGTNGYVDSDYVAITPNTMYQAYYVKTANTGGNVASRAGLKMKLKIY